MAITVATPSMKGRVTDLLGRHRAGYFTVTLDTSYPSPGGYAFDPKTVGFVGVVDRVIIQPRYAGTGATATLTRRFEYDYANKKIVAIVTSTGVEVANAVDVSGCVLDITVIGD
jgi:hypothetical protein